METDLINKAEDWIMNIHNNADHLIRTGFWIQEIYPEANEAMVIAAILHDVERAFEEGRIPPSPEFRGAKWDDTVYSTWHSKRSAQFTHDFLQREGKDTEFIEEVTTLINHHEEGGWKEADFLKDADSISFLEINAPLFISWIPKKLSKDEVQDKLDYMYGRIDDTKAKELASPFYNKAIETLCTIDD